MKSITKVTSVFLATTMLFASCAGNPDVFDVTNDDLETTKDKEIPLSVTIQKLDEINRNLPAPVNDVNSRKWYSGFGNLLSSDVDGALEGAQIGYDIGKYIGGHSSIGSLKGGIAGGIVGGLIGGVAGSYLAYVKRNTCEIFYLPPNYVMDECAELEEDPDAQVAFEEIEVPDSIERIGYIHNLAMDALINGESDFAVFSDEPPFLDTKEPGEEDYHRVITFTEFDKAVIASDAYLSAYNQIIYPSESAEPEEGEDVPAKTISEQVIERYLSALENYASPLDYSTIVSITNQYIAVVNESTELTDIDKHNLQIAFSVGVYSYKYWSNFGGDTFPEEE